MYFYWVITSCDDIKSLIKQLIAGPHLVIRLVTVHFCNVFNFLSSRTCGYYAPASSQQVTAAAENIFTWFR